MIIYSLIQTENDQNISIKFFKFSVLVWDIKIAMVNEQSH